MILQDIDNPFLDLPDHIYMLAKQNEDGSWDILAKRESGDVVTLQQNIPYMESADVLEEIRSYIGLTIDEVALQGCMWRNWIAI